MSTGYRGGGYQHRGGSSGGRGGGYRGGRGGRGGGGGGSHWAAKKKPQGGGGTITRLCCNCIWRAFDMLRYFPVFFPGLRYPRQYCCLLLPPLTRLPLT